MSEATELSKALPCPRCGYDLRGRAPEERCPECGVSVRAAKERANLAYADPYWLRRVRTGLALLMVSLALVAGMWIGWFALLVGEVIVRGGDPIWADALTMPAVLLTLAAATAGFAGALMITRPDAGDRSVRWRRTVRVSWWATLTAGLGGVVLIVRPRGVPLEPALLVMVAALIDLQFTVAVFAGRLIRRSPLRIAASPLALLLLLGLTELIALAYVVLFALNLRGSNWGDWVATLFVILAIAVPANVVLYLLLLRKALAAVRHAIRWNSLTLPVRSPLQSEPRTRKTENRKLRTED